jgi:hypothetical protein
VSGDDVYIAGDQVGYGAFVQKHTKETSWKNLYFPDANNRSCYFHSIFVSGDKIYVAGTEGDKATLWTIEK